MEDKEKLSLKQEVAELESMLIESIQIEDLLTAQLQLAEAELKSLQGHLGPKFSPGSSSFFDNQGFNF